MEEKKVKAHKKVIHVEASTISEAGKKQTVNVDFNSSGFNKNDLKEITSKVFNTLLKEEPKNEKRRTKNEARPKPKTKAKS